MKNKKQKQKYYATTDKNEVVKIRHEYGVVERPLRVEGNKVHTPEQLRKIRSRAVWEIEDLRKIEGW